MLYNSLRASETQRIIGVGFEKPHQHRTFLAVGRLSTSGAICDGKLLPIQTYQKLFSIMGTKYGGDGQRTFALPKIQPYGDTNFIIALEGNYPQRP